LPDILGDRRINALRHPSRDRRKQPRSGDTPPSIRSLRSQSELSLKQTASPCTFEQSEWLALGSARAMRHPGVFATIGSHGCHGPAPRRSLPPPGNTDGWAPCYKIQAAGHLIHVRGLVGASTADVHVRARRLRRYRVTRRHHTDDRDVSSTSTRHSHAYMTGRISRRWVWSCLMLATVDSDVEVVSDASLHPRLDE
jgi:hypothetical protein